MAQCQDLAPRWFGGHWRDWHRGHGCELDDGKQTCSFCYDTGNRSGSGEDCWCPAGQARGERRAAEESERTP